jgi:hypothetical protein
MIELMPDVPLDSYRLSADVMQKDGLDDGVVGLYLGQSWVHSEDQVHLYYHEVAFGDYPTQKFQEQKPGPVMVNLRRSVDHPDRGLEGPKFLFPLAGGEPGANPPQGSWRRLQIDVTPEALSVRQGSRKLGDIRYADWDKLAQLWLPVIAHDPDSFPGLRPKGGLGLYVFRGSARFRSVTLERIPNP